MTSLHRWPSLLCVAVIGLKSLAQPYVAPEPELPPWCTTESNGSGVLSIEFNGHMVEGFAAFRMGADDVFDQPVVLVEGFDLGSGWQEEEFGFGNLTWSRIHGTDPVGFPLGLDYRPLLDELHDLGGDLIFLDFAEGTTSVHNKAGLLNHLMEQVLDQDFGSMPIIVVGVSMGGVVTRLALTDWEALGVPHCVGHYYSLDAPHLGASLPVGLQALILGLSSTSETGQALWNALNSSAARELLQHHISGNDEFYAIQECLQQAGWPKRSLNFNIINSREGANAPLTTDPLLRLEWGFSWPWNTSTCYVEAERWSSSPNSTSASFVLPGSLFDLSGTSPLQVGSFSFPQPNTDPEIVAGSQSGHLSELAWALTESVPLAVTSQTLQTEATFIPHQSALGVIGGTGSPWTEVSVATFSEPRETHASLPSHHRDWLLSWITSLWSDTEAWSDIYSAETSLTVGWQQPKRRLIREGLISQQGTVVVGNSTVPFVAQTSPCEGALRIESGGQFHVGTASGARGKLRVGSGTSLNLGPGGVIEIHPGSTLVLEANGLLQFDGGHVIIHPGATFEVQGGGQIDAAGDGHMILEDVGATWQMNGQIVVRPGKQFTVLNRGNVVWHPGSDLQVQAQSSCDVRQENEGTTIFTGHMATAGPGTWTMDGGVVSFESCGSLHTHAATQWKNLEAVVASDGSNEEATVISSNLVSLSDCKLGNLIWNHEGSEASPKLFKLTSSEWVHGTCHVKHAQTRITDNRFDHAFLVGENWNHPSRASRNLFEASWYEDTPTFSLRSCWPEVWLEANEWIGGVGLEVDNSTISAACNSWNSCVKAVVLKGSCSSCFEPGCGGGQNRWVNNGVHVTLQEAPMPLLNDGHNHFGPVQQVAFEGITTHANNSWTVQGSHWHVSLLENPWFSPVPSNVMHVVDEETVTVSCFAQGVVADEECSSPHTERPRTKSATSSRLWDVLGRQVSRTEDAIQPRQ